MNENLDLTKILKDCPKGTKFYSPVYGKIEFIGIETFVSNPDPITIKWFKDKNTTYLEYLRADGTFRGLGECIIFPSEDQRDWSKWQRPFADGDIVFYSDTIAIFKEWGDETLFRTYVTKYLCCDSVIDMNTPLFGKGIRKEIRFATEKEKEQLFQAIKDHGYKWNAETKTLEALEDKGNISDGYHTFNELYEYRLLYNAAFFNELAKQGLYDVHKSRKHSDGTIPFGDENWFVVQAELPTGQISNHYEMKDWDLFKIPEKEKANPYDGHTPKDVTKRLRDFLSLDKLIVPKFKVGDIIRYAGEDFPIKIIDIKNNQYHIECFCDKYNDYKNGIIPVSEQNNYILIPKFNPKTLKPFDKVLVRDFNLQKWMACLFSHIDNNVNHQFRTIDRTGWYHCIPFNDDTKHLVGKTDEAPEFYRYWEE